MSVKEALAWSSVWVTMGLAFAVFVYFAFEGQWFGLGSVVERHRWNGERRLNGSGKPKLIPTSGSVPPGQIDARRVSLVMQK